MPQIKIKMVQKASTNQIYAGSFWGNRADLKNNYYYEVLANKKHFIKPQKLPVVVHFYFTFKKYPLDSDNCSYMGKMILDGMKKIGVIPDDSPKYVRGVCLYSEKGDSDSILIEYN
jgi:hypothetical protein